MTRKHIVSLLMSLLVLTGVRAADAPKDLVILLDSSASMFTHFADMGNAVIEPLLSSRVSNGDTVHIVSFSEKPRLELSRKVESPADIETIATHLLLIYPLEPWSDVIQALDWTGQYLKQLPSYRGKTLVIVSDGEHLAAPGSPNANISREEAKNRIEQSALELKGNGWDFLYLKTPWPAKPLASSSGTSQTQTATVILEGKTDPVGQSSMDPASTSERGSGNGATPRQEPSGAQGTRNTPADDSVSPPSTPSSTGKEPPVDDSQAQNDLVTADGGDSSSIEVPSDTAQGPDGGFDTSETIAETLPAELDTVDSETDGAETPGLARNELVLSWPEDLGPVKYRFALPVRVTNTGDKDLMFECRELIVDDVNVIEKPLFATIKAGAQKKLVFRVTLDEGYATGAQRLDVHAVFVGDTKIQPERASIALELVGKPSKSNGRLFSTILLIAGIVLALALAILILISFRRGLSSPAKAVYRSSGGARRGDSGAKDRRDEGNSQSLKDQKGDTGSVSDTASTKSVPASDSSTKVAGTGTGGANTNPASTAPAASSAIPASQARNMPVSEDFPVRRHEERIMLSLYVQDQNTAIGRRNVHLLKAGGKLSLGGGNSDFLVFIVRFPERIAKVHFDGEQCHLTIHKPEFFPDAQSSVIEDCIGKRIDIVSSKGYKVWFRIDRYEDPLEKLNRFLRSIEHPNTIK